MLEFLEEERMEIIWTRNFERFEGFYGLDDLM